MVSLSAISFATATALAGYLVSRCLNPPNPNSHSGQAWSKDSIGFFVSHPAAILVGRLIAIGFCLHHAIMTLFLDSQVPSQHGQLNLSLFRWTWSSSLGLLSLFVGAALRLAAFGALGSRFTFSLAKPNELKTTGIYAYIQHPSYTGLVLMAVPVHLLFVRWDAGPAYWISQSMVESLHGWGFFCSLVLIALNVITLGLRVSEEEAMLKEAFGKKWTTWNKRTKRFIPGII